MQGSDDDNAITMAHRCLGIDSDLVERVALAWVDGREHVRRLTEHLPDPEDAARELFPVIGHRVAMEVLPPLPEAERLEAADQIASALMGLEMSDANREQIRTYSRELLSQVDQEEL